jgi:hypothetical protein
LTGRTKLYDKKKLISIFHSESFIYRYQNPRSTYDIYISLKLIWYSGACVSYHYFLDWGLLTRKPLNRRSLVVMLKSSLRWFYGLLLWNVPVTNDHGYVQCVVLSIFMAYHKSNSTVATSVARNCLTHRSTRVHGVRAVYLSNYMFSCLTCRFSDVRYEFHVKMMIGSS